MWGSKSDFFANGGRSLNINHKLKIADFTLSRTKVHEKTIFLVNAYETDNEHQIIYNHNT